MLTIHLLTHNNEATIEACLKSLPDFEVIIGDLGSTDSTLEKCKKHKVVHFTDVDRGKCRNDLLDVSNTDWQLWVEPWEVLRDHAPISAAIKQPKDAYRLYNVQDKVIVKSTRLFRKSKRSFRRPVYETLVPDANDPLLNCVLVGSPPNQDVDALLRWKEKSPHTPDVEYYLALTYLSQGKREEFLRHAELFLFHGDNNSPAKILMHYYYAMVTRDVKHLIYCLMYQPTVAEFWCLLGDIFFNKKQFHRAIAFYDNAIIFGSRRLNDDVLPIEISKYKEYPEKMLNVCREVVKKVHLIH